MNNVREVLRKYDWWKRQPLKDQLKLKEVFNETEIQTLISLAQSVLDAKMPKEIPIPDEPLSSFQAGKLEGYNSALHDFRLYQEKCLGRLEGTLKRFQGGNELHIATDEGFKLLAQVIRNLFGGEK